MSRRSALHALLDRNLLLQDEYADGLSNHLPMALHALWRLGAEAAQMHRFFDTYAPRLGPVQCGGEAAPPPLADWLAHRGRYESLPALRSTFADLLERHGPVAVLRQAVPNLMPGVGAAAFHGVLRTAHAFEAGHAGELTHGLAYWAARWLPLDSVPVTGPLPGFDDWSAGLARGASGWQGAGALISHRMQEAGCSAPYRASAAGPARAGDTLARLAGLAATLHADTGNFTALHLVTGCRAARVLLPFADRPADALDAIVRAFTAAYLAGGIADATRAPPDSPAPWPALVASAMTATDEHRIKLVDACVEETAVYSHPAHRLAATRALH